MKKFSVLNKYIPHGLLLTVIAVALALAFVVGLPHSALADKILVPDVPDKLKPPEGAKVFLVGHAIGTQNYICLPSGAGFAYSLFTPQATLFDDTHEQIITHFFSVNPKNGIIRPTWQDSRDSSRVWAATVPDGAYTGSDFVEAGAIAWLLLKQDHTLDGPTGGDRLSETSFVQRLNTHGGSAPSTGCASLTDVGTRAFVPYTADYFFYRGGDN